MKIATKLTGITAGLLLLTIPATAFADATASITISGGGSHTVGSTFTATITENSVSAVNGARVSVTYNSALLQVVDTPTLGAFNTCPLPGGGNGASVSAGVVSYQCVALGGHLTGPQAVGTITFKALAAGTATLTTGSNTVITDATTSQNDWNGSGASTSYALSAPADQPAQNGSDNSGSNSAANNQTSKKSNITSPNTTSKSSTANSASNDDTDTSSASSAVKGAATTKKSNDKTATTPKSKSSHTGLIVSWVLGLLLAALAVGYIFMARKAKPAGTPANDVKAVAAKKVSATKQTAAKKPVKKA